MPFSYFSSVSLFIATIPPVIVPGLLGFAFCSFFHIQKQFKMIEYEYKY